MNHVKISTYRDPTKEQLERAKVDGTALDDLVKDHRISSLDKMKVVASWVHQGANIYAPLKRGESNVPYFVVGHTDKNLLKFLGAGKWGDLHTRLFQTALEIDDVEAITFFMEKNPPLHRLDITLKPVMHHRQWLHAFLEEGVGFGDTPLTKKDLYNFLAEMTAQEMIDAFDYTEQYKKQHITRPPLKKHLYKIDWKLVVEVLAGIEEHEDVMLTLVEKKNIPFKKLNHGGFEPHVMVALIRTHLDAIKAKDIYEVLFVSAGETSWLRKHFLRSSKEELEELYELTKAKNVGHGWTKFLRNQSNLNADHLKKVIERDAIQQAVAASYQTKSNSSKRRM